jgi:hypothetical protein
MHCMILSYYELHADMEVQMNRVCHSEIVKNLVLNLTLYFCVGSTDPSQSGVAMANPAGPVPRKMKAIFDYDPRESSPNADIEVSDMIVPVTKKACVIVTFLKEQSTHF